jgi:hypothetical protein
MFPPRKPSSAVVREVPQILHLSVRTDTFTTHPRQQQSVGDNRSMQDGFCPNKNPVGIIPIGSGVIHQQMQIVGLPLAAKAAHAPMQWHQ